MRHLLSSNQYPHLFQTTFPRLNGLSMLDDANDEKHIAACYVGLKDWNGALRRATVIGFM